MEQVEGLPAHYYAKTTLRLDPVQRIAHAEAFFAASRADILHGGLRAYYNPPSDNVQMPPIGAFINAEYYYAVLAHEVTHWTKHKARLDRDFGAKRFGDRGYAMELVAELGAAFLCADLDLTPAPPEDHTSYIGTWLKALKDDKRVVFTAASHAQRAADFLHALQPKAEEEEPERCPALSPRAPAPSSIPRPW